MYQVTYDTKSNGYLVSKTASFDSLKMAVEFIRTLQNTANVVGKPILETNK